MTSLMVACCCMTDNKIVIKCDVIIATGLVESLNDIIKLANPTNPQLGTRMWDFPVQSEQ